MIFLIHQKGVLPVTKQIENYIEENLMGQFKLVALDFVAFLRNNNVEFYKDMCDCWKDKIYYWVKLGDECENLGEETYSSLFANRQTFNPKTVGKNWEGTESKCLIVI